MFQTRWPTGASRFGCVGGCRPRASSGSANPTRRRQLRYVTRSRPGPAWPRSSYSGTRDRRCRPRAARASPRTVRIGDATRKGYKRAELLDAWARHLGEAVTADTAVTSQVGPTSSVTPVTAVTAVSGDAPDWGTEDGAAPCVC